MNIFQKIHSFICIDARTKSMLLEAYFYLALARFLKQLDFSRVALSLGESMEETPFVRDDAERLILQSVSDALHIMSRYTLWESECLVKAIAGMKMLKKRNIESTLYLGTAKDETGLIAHAWLRSGTFYVSGLEGMPKFTVVAKFACKRKDIAAQKE